MSSRMAREESRLMTRASKRYRPGRHARRQNLSFQLAVLAAVLTGCDGGSDPRLERPEEMGVVSDAQPTNVTADSERNSSSELGGAELPGAGRELSAPESAAIDTRLRFTEIAADLGISFVRYDDMRGQHRNHEANGGGVAALDYDADGRPDLFLTNGCRLPVSGSDDEHPSCLYRNRDGAPWFAAQIPAGVTPRGFITGCAVGDFDADGFPDLLLTAYGVSMFYLNRGDGTFAEASEMFSVNPTAWGTSAAFGDLDRDGLLDLFVGTYVEADDDPPQLCPRPESPDGYMQCPPTMFAGQPDILYWNDGQGGLIEVTEAAGLTGRDGKGLGVVLTDIDGDGLLDIYVANDGTPNFLYRNESQPGQLRFREQALLAGCAVNRDGLSEASMGIACGDYDRDGWQDLVCTHFFAETNTVYHNLGGIGFEDASSETRLGPPSRMKLGFGTVFGDFDHDGWLDLFVTNGHIDDFSWSNSLEPYAMPPHLFENRRDGTFVEVTGHAGDYFTRNWLGRGVATGDLDGDGDLDLIVSHQNARAGVLRNDSRHADRDWLQLRLVGNRASNRSAIGSRIELGGVTPTLQREIYGGGSFQSASSLDAHFGLPNDTPVSRVKIVWPSGDAEEFEIPARSAHYLAVEGTGRLLPTPAGS